MAKVDTDQMRKELRVGRHCSDCPHYLGGTGNASCRGHLQWVCCAINRAERKESWFEERAKGVANGG